MSRIVMVHGAGNDLWGPASIKSRWFPALADGLAWHGVSVEERDVSVMFTDIRNFTALVEELTPDQSLQLLNEFLTVISEVIEAHGGVVDKYLGDGVMALFGAPIAHEDGTKALLFQHDADGVAQAFVVVNYENRLHCDML